MTTRTPTRLPVAAARPEAGRGVLLASLMAYLALHLGDIQHGAFAALGLSRVVVLSLVVLTAAGLLWYAGRMENNPVDGAARAA